MLEQKDLDVLKDMMETVVKKSKHFIVLKINGACRIAREFREFILA